MQSYYTNTLSNTKYYDPSTQHYTFIRPSCGYNKSVYKNDPIIFYQIAGFKNYKTNTYDIRIIYIDSNNIITNFKNGRITKQEYKNLKQKVNNCRIKIYPVDTLIYIDMPYSSDIALARSQLLR